LHGQTLRGQHGHGRPIKAALVRASLLARGFPTKLRTRPRSAAKYPPGASAPAGTEVAARAADRSCECRQGVWCRAYDTDGAAGPNLYCEENWAGRQFLRPHCPQVPVAEA